MGFDFQASVFGPGVANDFSFLDVPSELCCPGILPCYMLQRNTAILGKI